LRRGRAAEWGPQGIIVFELDFRTDELVYLVAAVRTLKGSDCYGR